MCSWRYKYVGISKRTKARIIQASTSEIYGDPEIHPQTEDYKGAVSINGHELVMMKEKMAETLFWDYKRQHKVDVKVIRIFNTYGPRMQKMMVELFQILFYRL